MKLTDLIKKAKVIGVNQFTANDKTYNVAYVIFKDKDVTGNKCATLFTDTLLKVDDVISIMQNGKYYNVIEE